MNTKLKKLYKKLALMRSYDHALGIMGFDFETCVPQKAMEEEGEVLSFFSNESFKISKSKSFQQLVIDLYQEKDKLDYLDQILVKNLYESYLKTKNLTPKMQLELSKIYNQAYIDWLTAKSQKDYKIFIPSLKKVIEAQRKVVELRDEKLNDFYDNLLNEYEKGMLQEDLDVFFNDLKVGLIELLNKIKNSKKEIRPRLRNLK